MDSTFYTFMTDFMDEGQEVALGRIRAAGASGINVAAVYHATRDIFPHNPVRRVHFMEPGACYFHPAPDRYADLQLKPVASNLVRNRPADPMAELCQAADRQGIRVNAWVVYLHNAGLGFDRPDCAAWNVFGDPYFTHLCPANPHVRDYALALTGDLARYGFYSILAEGLHYFPLAHGYHHERYLFRLGTLAELLLGLCFCEHCVHGACERGVDVAAVMRFCRETIEKAMTGQVVGEPGEITVESLAGECGGELIAFLEFRMQTVLSLVEGIAECLDGSQTRLTFMDQAGAIKAGKTAKPIGLPTAKAAWQAGVCPRQIGDRVDGYEVLGYARRSERVRQDVEAYRALLPQDAELRCSLRPTLPDCDGEDNLRAKLDALDAMNISGVDFYHYALLPLRNVEMAGRAFGDRSGRRSGDMA